MRERFKFMMELNESDYDVLNEGNEIITSLKFRIGRNGLHNWILKFDEKISLKKAIKKVEKFLSKPLSEEYFDLVKDDIEYPRSLHTMYKSRAGLLGEVLLVGFKKNKPEFYTLIIDNLS